MEENKKLDIENKEAVEYTEEEMKKLQDEDLKGVAGGMKLEDFLEPTNEGNPSLTYAVVDGAARK